MTVKSFRLAGVCFVILTASICGRAQRDNPSLLGEVKVSVKGTAERATPPQATVMLFRPSGKKAALKYELFLKKKPDYPDRQKSESYIKANKKN